MARSQTNPIRSETPTHATLPSPPTAQDLLDHLPLKEDTPVNLLPAFGFQVPHTAIVQEVDHRLRQRPDLPGIIVTRPDDELWVISRQGFFEIIGRRYGVAVYMKRPIELIAKMMTPPLIIDETIPIPDAVALALQRPTDQVYTPLIIRYPNQQYKLLDVYTLLLAQSRIFAALQQELLESNLHLEERVQRRTNELVTVNEKLAQRYHYESALTRCADMLLESTNNTRVITDTLEVLLETAGVSRVYIAKNMETAAGEPIIKLIAQAHHPDLPPISRRHSQSYHRTLSGWFDQLAAGQTVVGHRDEVAGASKQLLTERHIESILLIPIGKPQDWYGFIAFDEMERKRHWDADDIELLSTVSHMLFAYIERERSRERLAEARDEAIEASQFKSELLAKVSHELRTPLGAILGYAQLLQMGSYGELGPEQKKPTDLIISSTNYLTLLINGLLDQAQLDNGKLVLHNAPFTLERLIHEIASRMEVLATSKGLLFEANIDPLLPLELVGDRLRLQQILVNLLGNAIKFTSDGFVRLSLYRDSPEFWVIEVSDSGIGIAPEAQAVIFDPFGQADGSATRDRKGTGLGLSITQQLVEMMGGEIVLESALNQGSVFTIRLPFIWKN